MQIRKTLIVKNSAHAQNLYKIFSGLLENISAKFEQILGCFATACLNGIKNYTIACANRETYISQIIYENNTGLLLKYRLIFLLVL